MRILYPIEGDGGGAVTHVLALASELSKRSIGASVAFLTNGPSVSVADNSGLEYDSVMKRFLLDLAPVGRLVRLLDRRRISIIHTHTIRGNFYGRIAARLSRKPLMCVTTVHSHIADELKGEMGFGPRDWLLSKRESCTWSFVDHFVCVSGKIKERLLSNKVPEDKITVIENAVALVDLSAGHLYNRSIRREFHIGDEEIVVGTVGRLVPLKNHVLFLNSAKQLSDRVANIRFFIVGDGPLIESLMDKARELGIMERVTFTGWRNDIQEVVSAFDIYVICSIVEGLNMSVLEAMACAKPVVGTNVRGISDVIVENENGLLVPSNNVNSLTEAVLRLANNPGERKRMGLNGRRLVEREYSMEKMIDRTLKVYTKSSPVLHGDNI